MMRTTCETSATNYILMLWLPFMVQVDGVVDERDGAKRRQRTEENKERAGELEVGEVDGVDWTGGSGRKRRASCMAWGRVTLVPGGEGVGGVGKALLDLLEKETFLV
ncbi:hypothetical protein V6N13_000559 [Hibiscus sabdariffa]|uniref:Uncharacterized protein n=1 Tax=Hibiscus sabdariffa TaxID=183260 RepID=A0ABR2G6I5_9ROSI